MLLLSKGRDDLLISPLTGAHSAPYPLSGKLYSDARSKRARLNMASGDRKRSHWLCEGRVSGDV